MSRFLISNEYLNLNVSNINIQGESKIKSIVDSKYLDSTTNKIKDSLMPALSINETYTVVDIPARDALTVQKGDVAIVTSIGNTYIYNGSSWDQLIYAVSMAGLTDTDLAGLIDNMVLKYDNATGKWVPTISYYSHITTSQIHFLRSDVFKLQGVETNFVWYAIDGTTPLFKINNDKIIEFPESMSLFSSSGQMLYNGTNFLLKDSLGVINLRTIQTHVDDSTIHYPRSDVFKLINPETYFNWTATDGTTRLFRVYNNGMLEFAGTDDPFTLQAQLKYSAGSFIFNDTTGQISLRSLQSHTENGNLHNSYSSKGQLQTTSNGTSVVYLNVGTNNYLLRANSLTTSGLEWVDNRNFTSQLALNGVIPNPNQFTGIQEINNDFIFQLKNQVQSFIWRRGINSNSSETIMQLHPDGQVESGYNGNSSSPSFSWTAAQNCGYYLETSPVDELSVTVDGNKVAGFNSSRAKMLRPVSLQSYSNLSPADGDIWFESSAFQLRQGGVTYDLVNDFLTHTNNANIHVQITSKGQLQTSNGATYEILNPGLTFQILECNPLVDAGLQWTSTPTMERGYFLDGSQLNPSITFNSQTTTGFYYTANTINVSIDNFNIGDFKTTGLNLNRPLKVIYSSPFTSSDGQIWSASNVFKINENGTEYKINRRNDNFFHQGSSAGASITTGNNFLALQNSGALMTTGDGNIMIGLQCFNSTGNPNNCIMLGNTCGYNMNTTTSDRHIFLGQEVARNVTMTSVNDCIIIGTQNTINGSNIGSEIVNIGAYNSSIKGTYGVVLGSRNGLCDSTIMVGHHLSTFAKCPDRHILIGNHIGSNSTAISSGPGYHVLMGDYCCYNGTAGDNIVCIGSNANYSNGQNSANSIAIGGNAGYNNLHASSLVLNSSGANLDTVTSSSTYISNIRDTANGANDYYVFWNNSTKELHIDSACSIRIKKNLNPITGVKYLDAISSLTVYDFESLDESITGIKRSLIAEDIAKCECLSDIVSIIPEYKILKNNPLYGQVKESVTKDVDERDEKDPTKIKKVQKTHTIMEPKFIEEYLYDVPNINQHKLNSTLIVCIQELKKIIDAQEKRITSLESALMI